MSTLALITPTSDRPIAFELCERWMSRALNNVREPVTWYVVDDGVTPVQCHLSQVHLRRQPSGDPKSSFLGNLEHALREVQASKILFIEDDDWYAPDYLRTMSSLLDDADIVGEGHAKYYNVATRHFKTCGNTLHASLCQTGIRGDLGKWMASHIGSFHRIYVDIHLWRTGATERKQYLRPESALCVGIKGMPGKNGIGIGHRMAGSRNVDTDGSVLNSWIGRSDAELYRELTANSL